MRVLRPRASHPAATMGKLSLESRARGPSARDTFLTQAARSADRTALLCARMALRDWLRPPRQVLGIFLAVAVLSTAALGWLTWRLLDQDAQLEAQRERVRLEQAADATVAGMQRSLAGTDGAAGLSRHGQLHGLPHIGPTFSDERFHNTRASPSVTARSPTMDGFS